MKQNGKIMGKVRNGSKVKIVIANHNWFQNKVGDIGTVNSYESDDMFRVHVEGKENISNWTGIEEIEVLEY